VNVDVGQDHGGYSPIIGTGVQAKIGVTWLILRTPWEVYGEAVPALNLIGGLSFGAGAAVGGRYYFF